jgi:hypothetical protein
MPPVPITTKVVSSNPSIQHYVIKFVSDLRQVSGFLKVDIMYTNLIQMMLVGWFIVINATFNNISVISSWTVLLVEETLVP